MTNKQPRRRNASSASDGLEFKSLHCAAEIRRRRPILFSSLFLRDLLGDLSAEVERESDARARERRSGGGAERLVKIRKDILSFLSDFLSPISIRAIAHAVPDLHSRLEELNQNLSLRSHIANLSQLIDSVYQCMYRDRLKG